VVTGGEDEREVCGSARRWGRGKLREGLIFQLC
jgi:hypothetical protein